VNRSRSRDQRAIVLLGQRMERDVLPQHTGRREGHGETEAHDRLLSENHLKNSSTD
jgi:hypothetical protein